MSTLSALALFGTLGTPELIIILVILLLIFGGSKLPQLGQALGKTIKGFKQEMKEGLAEGTGKEPGIGATDSIFCPKCGLAQKDSSSSYCPKCGAKL